MITELFPSNKSKQNEAPFVIAGPCSVETPEQLMTTVGQLKKEGISWIRGGVWKPRTRPGSFEGVGEIALPWIQAAKKEFGVKFAIEVASANHVELALKHDMDMLWVGARSTANPFTVQEIAESLKGAKVPVLIKNPINADLSLWQGAFERFQKAGITDLAAVHRGFSNLREQVYRNSPMWQIPIDFKRTFPEIPMICDPSHIAGKRSLVQIIAQKALDLSFDGFLIESHHQPDLAWSDAAQQLTPQALGEMLKNLKTRSIHFEGVQMRNQLEEIRAQIDQADHELLEAIHRRMTLIEKIGEYKKLNNVAVLDLDRWKEIFETRPVWGQEMGINEELIQELFALIHQESVKKQTEILDKVD
ncbi:chorismate mutase [Algoriphagus namhaensis]|uniref:chorismate mutase n=1 Tax=Algoriphagus namhaensis TaxID=915353 RepID=A0ABV8ARK9_9BACT